MSNKRQILTPLGPGRYGYSLSDITGFRRASSATYFDSGGVLRTAAINEPRFEGGQLLIEEQRTNYARWSQDFTNAAWQRISLVLAAGTDIAPDGTPTMSTITGAAATTSYLQQQVFGLAAASVYTASMFLKQGTSPANVVRLYDTSIASFQAGAIVNWIGGAPVLSGLSGWAVPPTVEATTIPGIYRFSGGVNTGVLTGLAVLLYPSAANAAESVKAWGIDLEDGPASTSYIPTAGSAATRAADFASLIQYVADELASLTMTIDGKVVSTTGAMRDPLTRAVIISLFTWRRALPDDPVEGIRWGWWGDGLDGLTNDRIGSRLWLLGREKLTLSTINRAREYAEEALQWMLDDGVASRVTVTTERRGLDALALRALIERDNEAPIDLRFDNAWSFFNV